MKIIRNILNLLYVPGPQIFHCRFCLTVYFVQASQDTEELVLQDDRPVSLSDPDLLSDSEPLSNPEPLSRPAPTSSEGDTIPQEERVTIRLKFLNDSQRDVEASLLENIGNFIRRNFTVEMAENKNVRLIFNGQVLREETNTLRSYGIFDKCVVHCLIHQQAAPPPASAGPRPQAEENTEDDFDLSEAFIPILGVALIFLWYFAFTYSSYFNMMSSTALLGLTSLFLLSVYGTNFHVNVAVRAR